MDQELYGGAIRVRVGAVEAMRPDGSIAWRWQPAAMRVLGLLPVPEGGEAIVLAEPVASLPKGVPNLFRCRPDGGLAWTAEVLTSGDGTYVAARWSGDELLANTWDGRSVAINPATGRVESVSFVK